MRPVIVIRPEPGNAATVAAARELGLEAHAFPLFDMAPAPWTAPDPAPYRALLAGSANVFRLGGEGLARLTGLPVHAVGPVTAEAAGAAGFRVERIGEGGLQPMVSALPPGRYLRLAGEKRVPLAMPDGVEVDDIVVYAAAGLPMPPALAEMLLKPALVLLHSGEAAAHFAAESARLGVGRAGVSLACLASRIGLMAGEGWQHIEIAQTRSDQAVLALAVQMCDKVSPEGH
ncbi:MAG: uroporphyrinogen-III synthase [Sphingomonadales bacterium]|uniref:uroporphyrinogen-III synthase n=1 Tax=Novosphingobium sp. NDB2Meth1 TaxID=1892847 RepID=UPI000931A6A7|nr:uroporphyrinogen-III synthase [Novosphingobium sp. NDB2Meth1]MBU6393392.1 uroporphyrinogen-III synthase [Sphingomonadales bacterium]